MSIDLESVRSNVDLLAPVLWREPNVRASLRGLDLTATLTLILALLGSGVATAEGIKTYLSSRRLRHDDDAVQFMLDAFEGGDRRHHLWTIDDLGRYVRIH